jgi:signal transduction histidine kinase
MQSKQINDMNRQWPVLLRRYHAALQKHLRQRSSSRASQAHRLGEQALALGMETLDLARLHKGALAQVIPPGASSAARNRTVSRASFFFAEAVAPIEKTHRAGVKTAARLDRKHKMLARRTAQLVAANHHLKQGIVHRKTAEAALEKSVSDCAKLLQESDHLREHLQRCTHRIMAAQENERSKVSHELRDEIAQTLLGINVRLLTLKNGARTGNRRLAKEIASTQRLVEQSVRAIDGFAREMRVRNET